MNLPIHNLPVELGASDWLDVLLVLERETTGCSCHPIQRYDFLAKQIRRQTGLKVKR